jgi:lipoprotein-anchoring transpeptidase ErfK/SrfK
MRALSLVAIGLIGLTAPAFAAPQKAKTETSPDLSLERINAADLSEKSAEGISPLIVKAQVLLDRARFSPGVIDGRDGDNFRRALAAFEQARGLNPDGQLDEDVLAKLVETSGEPAVSEYTVAEADVKGPFTKRIPDEMEAQADLERLGYTGPEELLAEKFHMSEDLLEALNRGKSVEKAGTTIVVANVQAPAANGAGGNAATDKNAPKNPKAAVVEVDKKERLVRAVAEDGSLLAVYPASIGSEEKPAPEGEHTVRAVAMNPTYTYNPDYAFKGVKAKEKFTIKPGPNNPVGSVWIDLSIESFGIHGTPEPAKVGKAYSHGCVRLTNWDVEELAKMVEKGTKVVFKG